MDERHVGFGVGGKPQRHAPVDFARKSTIRQENTMKNHG
jgi:hypothetical protein